MKQTLKSKSAKFHDHLKTIFFVPLSTIKLLAKTAKLPKSANLLHKTAKSAKSLKSAALTAGET